MLPQVMAPFLSSIFLLCVVQLCGGQECPSTNSTCRFSIIIEPQLTMMYNKTRVKPCNGQLCYYDQSTPLPDDVQSKIITADGVYSRLVISVNGDIPGPALIVYEDQQVEVDVTNLMHTDSITIHFHGGHQKGSPFMDGVAYVSQCPIHPEQTFRYSFKASPHGTHWYHAHIGDQRSMGLYGPFIVRRRSEPPEIIDEHIITLQDWNHDMDPETAYLKMINGVFDCSLDGSSCQKYQTTESLDGANFSVFQFHSGLINGKGRFYLGPTSHNNAPLTRYTVERDRLYRFRVISAATLYPFRLYVAGHKLSVVASDGRELEPIEVESFIIQTGERMDFILNATQPAGDYMIIAETLEVISGNKAPHKAEAILHYNNTPPAASPSTTAVPCSEFLGGFCPVFNCPFLYYPSGSNRNCITFHEASANANEIEDDYDEIMTSPADKLFFLNFAFPGKDGDTPGSVNGRQYRSPPVSALSQPQELGSVSCDNEDCGSQKICSCMYNINIENNDIVEMVFLNMGVGSGWSHPVHLHGHSFYVRAMGFPEYDPNTGKIINPNRAVNCRGSYCNNATWHGGGRSRRQTDGTREYVPLKDTIVVPTGGYVIVRFKADNPGVWFLHCHIDVHNTNGMAMVVNESFSLQPKSQLPRCRNYLTGAEYNSLERKYVGCSSEEQDSWKIAAITLGVILGIIVFCLLIVLVVKVIRFCRG